jgi:hypothetical protein
MAEDQISTDLRLQKNVDGLGDAIKRIELLEEFLYVALHFTQLKIVTL